MSKIRVIEMDSAEGPFAAVSEAMEEWLDETGVYGPFQLPAFSIDDTKVRYNYLVPSLSIFGFLGVLLAHGELVAFTNAVIAGAEGASRYILFFEKREGKVSLLISFDYSRPMDVFITLAIADSIKV